MKELIEKLKNLKRYDVYGGESTEYTNLSYEESEWGHVVVWDDIEKIIEEYKDHE